MGGIQYKFIEDLQRTKYVRKEFSPFCFLPIWLSWDISFHLLQPLDWNLHYWLPCFSDLQTQTKLHHQLSRVSGLQEIMEIFSLRNYVSQFLIIIALCLSLPVNVYIVLLILSLWRTLTVPISGWAVHKTWIRFIFVFPQSS